MLDIDLSDLQRYSSLEQQSGLSSALSRLICRDSTLGIDITGHFKKVSGCYGEVEDWCNESVICWIWL